MHLLLSTQIILVSRRTVLWIRVLTIRITEITLVAGAIVAAADAICKSKLGFSDGEGGKKPEASEGFGN